MKYHTVALYALLLLLFIFVTNANATAISGNESDGQSGFFVYVQESGIWQKRGFLPYTDMFSEDSMRVEAGNGPVSLRLVKKGKGTGHPIGNALGSALVEGDSLHVRLDFGIRSASWKYI